MSGPGSHPRNGTRLRSRFAAPGPHFFASPKRRAFGSVHCPAISASLRSAALRSGQTLKTSGDRDATQAPAETVPGPGACACSASAVGFLRLAPRTHSGARGAEMAWVKNADEVAFFRACEGDSASRSASSVDEGASPSSTSEHRKNPGGPLGEARAGPTCEDIRSISSMFRLTSAKQERARPAKNKGSINCSYGINVNKKQKRTRPAKNY